MLSWRRSRCRFFRWGTENSGELRQRSFLCGFAWLCGRFWLGRGFLIGVSCRCPGEAFENLTVSPLDHFTYCFVEPLSDFVRPDEVCVPVRLEVNVPTSYEITHVVSASQQISRLFDHTLFEV